MATSENQKPGCTEICEGSIRKIGAIKDKVIWEVVKHGQKEKVP